MRIVKTDKALTIRPVQRQRIIEPVRLRLCCSDPSNNEPDPMPGFRIDNEDLAVQVKQAIQGRVMFHSLYHYHRMIIESRLRLSVALHLTLWR